MGAAIGSLVIDETFTGAVTKYSVPVNVAGRSEGDLHGLAATNNVTVTREISQANELGPWVDSGDAAVVFAAGTGNKIYPVGLAAWTRFKMVSAGNATFKARFVTNPVAQ